MAGEAFKAKVGFGAEIGIIAKAKVEVGKFSTVSRGANSNIEGLNSIILVTKKNKNLTTLIIKLAKYVNLIALVFVLKRPKYILIVTNFFSYLLISF